MSEVPAAPMKAVEAQAQKAEACLLKIAAERRDEMVKQLAHSGTLDADHVHDLRVSVRRMTEAVRILESVMDKVAGRAIDDSLRSLRRAAGNVRDTDVTSAHLAKWRMPAAVRHIAQQVRDVFAKERPGQEQLLRDAIGAASTAGTLVLLARVLEEQTRPECIQDAEGKLKARLEGLRRKREKQLKKAFGEAARRQTPKALHGARIAAKKLRYVMELEHAAGKAGAKKAVKFLKKIQEILGEHHDAEVVTGVLQRKIPPRRAPKGLRPAWQKWRRDMTRKQSRRVADFLMRTYEWMNR